jgi:hypothetical protein
MLAARITLNGPRGCFRRKLPPSLTCRVVSFARSRRATRRKSNFEKTVMAMVAAAIKLPEDK